MNRREQAQTLLTEARRLDTISEHREVIRCIEKAHALDTGTPASFALLGTAHARLQQWSHAIDAWRRAVEQAPDDRQIVLGWAECLRQGRCHHAALSAYEQLLELEPGNVYGLAGKAETLRMLGRVEQALVWFDLALTREPEHAFALRGKAATLNALHRWHEALPLWSEALSLEPESSFARAGREESQQGLIRVQHLGESPAPPPSPAPTSPERAAAAAHAEWARCLFQDGRLDLTIEALQHGIQADPSWDQLEAEIGAVLVEDGQLDAAAAVYRDLVARAPDRTAFQLRLAEAERRCGHYDDAAQIYREVLQRAPTSLSALSGLGETLRIAGDYGSANRIFARALSIAPDHAWALRGRAAALAALGEHAEAIALWNTALKVEPDSDFARSGLEASTRALERGAGDREHHVKARVQFEMGRAWLQQERPADAVRAFQKATEHDARWHEPWFFMGIAHEQAGESERAIQAFDACLVRKPDEVEAMVHRAECLLALGIYDTALEGFEAAAELSPQDLRVLIGRAESLRGLERPSDALPIYDDVLAVQPHHLKALVGKATALDHLGRSTEALAVWSVARETAPSDHDVLRGIAACEGRIEIHRPRGTGSRDEARQALDLARRLHKAKNLPAAINACERALELDPSFAEAALRLGMLLDENGQVDKAIIAYERCLQVEPSCYQAHTNIGECKRKQEDYLGALNAFDRALEIQPNYLYAVSGRAETMRMLGRYSECLPLFDRALALEPRHIFALQGKAAALNSLLEHTEALTYWNRALEVDPKSRFALEGRAACEAHLRAKGPAIVGTGPSSDSTTPTLDEQGRDLTDLARRGELGEIIGRTQEIRSLMKTLVRRQKANPILLGEPGVGKTAVVEGLAHALLGADLPPRLRGLRIVELSIGSLVAGTKYRGTFEDRLKTLIAEAKEQPGTVLFIDEIHTLVGAGRTEGGSLDAANILKPALARGDITVIGATTLSEFRKHIEPDSALERRFQPIYIDEPTHDEALDLLRGLAARYVDHHGVEIDEGALHACVQLSSRYVPDRQLPDKALDLLDESCAEASLEELPVVTSRIVAQVLADRTGIPVQHLTAAERERLGQLEQRLQGAIKGQPVALSRLARAVRLCRSGLRSPERPRGVFLFVGPSGVGKTEVARQLSDQLFPEGKAFIRLDMSEYADKFTISRLIGAPPGYAGHGEPGQLTERLRRRPYAVVLLDEFEKAHPEVQTLFLSLFDEGRITDSEGREVDARQAMFVLTSNAGSETAGGSALGFGGRSAPTDADRLVLKAREHFKPELINRIDDIVPFAPLSAVHLQEIAELHLHRLASRAHEAGATLTWSSSVAQLCANHGESVAYGARPVLRAIESMVAEPLSQALLLVDRSEPVPLHADVHEGAVRVAPRTADASDPEAERLEQV